MDYEIVSGNQKIYVKLDSGGRPVTCGKSERGKFEKSKAKNILNSLPKTLRKFHFKMEAIPDIPPKEESIPKPKVIENVDYVPSSNVTQWIEKFGQCGDILNAAIERHSELVKNLSDLDKGLTDLLHSVELERPKDLFKAWIIYTDIRTNRRKRRDVKDELRIIRDVIHGVDPAALQREHIKKSVDDLVNRKYIYRIIEDDEEKENK